MATQRNPTSDDKKKSLDDGGFDFLGKELDDNARIWSVYRDEVTADDKAHGFEGWLQTLDVLLIFAGLFSAVVTAFLIDSYKLLQKPATDDFVAAALYALVVATNNSALLLNLPKPRPLSSDPSTLERWVNALWFTSLFIALAVALLPLLAKQWIQEFHRRLADREAAGRTPTGANEWTRKRWFYLQGMTRRWPTDAFITYLLPLMLHIALFLFLAGLSLFLWSVDKVVSLVVLALSAFLVAFYAACTLLPLCFPDAPTSTPFLNQLVAVVHTVPISILRISIEVCKCLQRLERPNSPLELHPLAGPLPSSAGSEAPPSPSGDSLPSPVQATLAAQSRVQGHRTRLEVTLARLHKRKDPSTGRPETSDERERRIVDMLGWLIITGPSEHAVMFAFQAVGAVSLNSPYIPRLQAAAVGMSALTQFKSGMAPTALEAIRAIRSELLLGRGVWRSEKLVLHAPEPILHALENLPNNSDAILFLAAIRGTLPSDVDDVLCQLDSESITTRSARLLLHCQGPMDVRVLLCLLACVNLASLDEGDYDRIFELFGSWDATCTCGTRSLLCLLPFMADVAYVEHGGLEIWRSSLPAFIASRILRYCAQSGNYAPGLRHRHQLRKVNCYQEDIALLDFLDQPGWLHPMVLANISRSVWPDGASRDELYMGSPDKQANLAFEALLVMSNWWSGQDRERKVTLHSAPIATLHSLNPSDFLATLLSSCFPWRYYCSQDVRTIYYRPELLKQILVRSLRWFLFLSALEEEADRPYSCTDALLGIAVGLSSLWREGQRDIRAEIQHLMALIPRCSWHDADRSNPIVTHLAQHIRELQVGSADITDWLNVNRWDSWHPLGELVENATPCTLPECAGTPPTSWAELHAASLPENHSVSHIPADATQNPTYAPPAPAIDPPSVVDETPSPEEPRDDQVITESPLSPGDEDCA